MGWCGFETNADSTVLVPLDDVVVGLLPVAARCRHVARQYRVELKYDVRCEGHIACGLMNQPERVAVTSHLLFRSIARLRVLDHQRLQPVRANSHTLEPVRRFT